MMYVIIKRSHANEQVGCMKSLPVLPQAFYKRSVCPIQELYTRMLR